MGPGGRYDGSMAVHCCQLECRDRCEAETGCSEIVCDAGDQTHNGKALRSKARKRICDAVDLRVYGPVWLSEKVGDLAVRRKRLNKDVAVDGTL